MDDDIDSVEWDFSPFFPPRPDCPSENSIMKQWRALMMRGTAIKKTETTMLIDRYFIDTYPNEYPLLDLFKIPPSKREAQVASSLIRWLGAPLGLQFLMDSKDKSTKHTLLLDEAYLVTWALWNKPSRLSAPRRAVMNGVKTTIEDWQTMENVCLWLGSPSGQLFIKEFQTSLLSARQKHRPEPGANAHYAL